MRPILLLLASLLAATPAAAQPFIRAGQRVTGELTPTDSASRNGSRYDLWRFAGQAHHRYRVTLRSDQFDAVVIVGTDTGIGCVGCRVDDDGGGGTNASLAYTAGQDTTQVESMVRRCFDSSDYREGRRAFLDKRPPVFTGR